MLGSLRKGILRNTEFRLVAGNNNKACVCVKCSSDV